MSDLNRRDALKLMGLMAAASTFSFGCTTQDLDEAQRRAEAGGETLPGPDYERTFLTDHEFETVRVLADWIIPADERSGSASDARVPQFIDFIMTDELLWNREQVQTSMRGGLAWVDYTCLNRYEAPFIECSENQQQDLLDLIAYPNEAPPEMSQGVAFFNSLRDLTATGFWSSKMGMEDLQYMGNTFVGEWRGCPNEALEHIGVSYDNWDGPETLSSGEPPGAEV